MSYRWQWSYWVVALEDSGPTSGEIAWLVMIDGEFVLVDSCPRNLFKTLLSPNPMRHNYCGMKIYPCVMLTYIINSDTIDLYCCKCIEREDVSTVVTHCEVFRSMVI